MAAAKFTPGPWVWGSRLSGSENHRGFNITPHKVAGWALAHVQPGDSDGNLGEANARLIAASPSMYSLLETAHDFIDRHSDVNRDGDGPNEAMALAASIRELLETIDGAKV